MRSSTVVFTHRKKHNTTLIELILKEIQGVLWFGGGEQKAVMYFSSALTATVCLMLQVVTLWSYCWLKAYGGLLLCFVDPLISPAVQMRLLQRRREKKNQMKKSRRREKCEKKKVCVFVRERWGGAVVGVGYPESSRCYVIHCSVM